MALKITLKPHERLIIGGAVITNGDTKGEFVVGNTIPILREKDIMALHEADTPCKKIYFVIQLMYVDGNNMTDHHSTYWELVKDVAEAAPSRKPLLHEISRHILQNSHYQALKLTRKLIDYEKEIITHVRNAT